MSPYGPFPGLPRGRRKSGLWELKVLPGICLKVDDLDMNGLPTPGQSANGLSTKRKARRRGGKGGKVARGVLTLYIFTPGAIAQFDSQGGRIMGSELKGAEHRAASLHYLMRAVLCKSFAMSR